MTLEKLQAELDEIKRRNRRVELNKAWETSWTRRGLILVLTYGVVLSFFLIAGFPNPWLSAIVPSLGFLLSTLTLSAVKGWWIS
jgi:hypothetical protein